MSDPPSRVRATRFTYPNLTKPGEHQSLHGTRGGSVVWSRMRTQLAKRMVVRLLTMATAPALLLAACSSSETIETTTSLEVTSTTAEPTTTTLPPPPTTTTTTQATTTTTEPAAINVDPSAVVGTWQGWNYYTTFTADEGLEGSWRVHTIPRATSGFDSGKYTFDGLTLTMFSRDRGPCEGGVGNYEVTFSASLDEMRLTAIGDQCTERQSEMLPSMRRYGS